MTNRLPKSVTKYFWGDNLEDLNWKEHKAYITRTLLEKGDLNSIKWLMKQIDKNYLQQILSEKKLDSKSQNFWSLYL